MTGEKTYVCTRCRENAKPCVFKHQAMPPPAWCGSDTEGKMIACEWHEVPEKVIKIAGLQLPF